ncbi:hypothetical protein MNV_2060019 [Candidatus Methanoperedens nitroreducens]|uniref:Uncharacterized protein n=2 Tax=Candidatus Methanoperedens nitratireducens TaxID=1392998 RepID=A0A284VNW2_9EURY|nr:hypothetical protein MNV_2060019 [Candidatus Methanoperedens nitroreducens]
MEYLRNCRELKKIRSFNTVSSWQAVSKNIGIREEITYNPRDGTVRVWSDFYSVEGRELIYVDID